MTVTTTIYICQVKEESHRFCYSAYNACEIYEQRVKSIEVFFLSLNQKIVSRLKCIKRMRYLKIMGIIQLENNKNYNIQAVPKILQRDKSLFP